eukprot:2067527-Rhodomonas_salina.2
MTTNVAGAASDSGAGEAALMLSAKSEAGGARRAGGARGGDSDFWGQGFPGVSSRLLFQTSLLLSMTSIAMPFRAFHVPSPTFLAPPAPYSVTAGVAHSSRCRPCIACAKSEMQQPCAVLTQRVAVPGFKEWQGIYQLCHLLTTSTSTAQTASRSFTLARTRSSCARSSRRAHMSPSHAG